MHAPVATAVPLDASRPRLIESLLDPAAYPHPTGAIRLVETHISWVILTGPFVYKLKKPCNLGFLDYTTLEQRRHFCTEEVRVSGRFAPALYVAAVPITGTPAAPHVDGPGEPIEWAVKLVQFDEADRLDNRFESGRLTAADCAGLGAEIARVQERLAIARPAEAWGTARSVIEAVTINLDELVVDRPDAAGRVAALRDWLVGRLAEAAPVIESRRQAGRVRECHGDLHLANLVLHDGRMTAFDAIEFSPGLRWIDVANDVAFLAMDLESRGRPDLAAHVVSSWAEAADDHAALRVMRLYEVYRAVVRASVAAIRGRQASGPARATACAETDRYLTLAESLMTPLPPRLFVTSGISGSGKTTVSSALVGGCGALRLRSDVERKRIAGLEPTDRPVDTATIYGAAMHRRVYERLATLARELLEAGASVVVDAACNRRWQRDLLAAVAEETRIPLIWLEFDVPVTEAVARVIRRERGGADASDASADVVRMQRAEREPIGADECGPPRTLVTVTAADVATPTRLVTRLAGLTSRPTSAP